MEKSTMSTMCSLAVRMMLVIGDDDGAAEVVHNGLHRISAHHESTITSTHWRSPPDSVQCWLGQRGTHSLAAVAADKFNQRKGLKLTSLHQPDTDQVETSAVIATPDRWSGPKLFANPETGLKCWIITFGKHLPSNYRAWYGTECADD